MTPFRDVISITDLQLRAPVLPPDLWQRTFKSQPLLLSLSILTSISSEASTDSLLSDSLNYGTVTKIIEKTVAELDPATELALECVAERIAKEVITRGKAPSVKLELRQPRGLLSAESVGVEIYRSRENDYDTNFDLLPSRSNEKDDKFVVKGLRREIIIGINKCEREAEQEVLVDLEFGAAEETRMNPFSIARAEWAGWRGAIKTLQSHLTTSQPLTIESITTDLARLILAPSATFSVPSTTVRISKPCALMYAKYPAVQITRIRSDFYEQNGRLKAVGGVRGVATDASTTATMTTDGDGSQGTTESADTEVSRGGGSGTGGRTVYLGIGTNMGERVGNIQKALKELERGEGGAKTKVVDVSFLYESEAMYVEEQAKFLNAAIKIETTLSPLTLLHFLKSIEDRLGRVKTIRNGPRVIDLDILYYEDEVLDTREDGEQGERWLKIPHQSIQEREFVLRPLNDLIPTMSHPTLGTTTSSLLSQLLSSTPSTLHRVLPITSSLTHPCGTSTLLMSILNATPDSFSDGGDNFSIPSALNNAKAHIKAGSEILDVGGMSTRPGAEEVSEAEEIRRVVPLIKALREEGITTPISIDTYRHVVARAAIVAGADIINDVLGGSMPGMLETMAELDVPVILMHSRAMSDTMSDATNTDYGAYEGGVVEGVRTELGERVERALQAGVKRWNIVLDPGIGFAKTKQGNLELLKRLPEVLGRGSTSPSLDHTSNDFRHPSYLGQFPSLVGLSRKKFIGTMTGKDVAKERVWGTGAGVTASIAGGADIVRVHDVAEMKDVVNVADGIYRSRK